MNKKDKELDSYTIKKKAQLEFTKSKIKKKQYYYTVIEGYKPGVYYSWNECQEQTKGYPNPIFKKFSKKEDAFAFLNGDITLDDFKVKEDEIAIMSVNDKNIIDLDNDKNIFNIKTFNKYDNDFYIFTDGSYHKDKNKKLWKSNNKINKIKTKHEEEDNRDANIKANMVSKFGVYFGMESINISHKETKATINQCELLAIKYALIVLDNYKKQIKIYQKEHTNNMIHIVSDSQYSIKALMIWIDNWLKNDWKTQLDEPVKNKEIFISINLLMSKLKLHKIRYKFIHFNSHQPPPISNPKEMFLWKGNQLADYLAKDYCY
mgnify:CR=1 FL=1